MYNNRSFVYVAFSFDCAASRLLFDDTHIIGVIVEYRTRMVVPYAYTVSHSIKLSIGTGGSIPNAYYAQKAMSFI